MEMKVRAINKEYSIHIGRGILNNIGEYIKFPHKTLVLTDDNIPEVIIDKITNVDENMLIMIIGNGEDSKSLETYQEVLKVLMENEFSREDLLISLGGGVIGDLGGFVASTYKRGIRFINIPTTTLSMVDSSIGGKNGVNFLGIKNAVGSFYQPEMVLIDLDTLESLPKRHFYNGLIEALKSGLIGDSDLYKVFLSDFENNLEEVIIKSLNVKKKIVEEDPFEKGIRKVLNFGHTYGHAIESYFEMKEIYHGEAVGLGMLVVLDGKLKEEVKNILLKFNIDTNVNYAKEEILKKITQDKKATSNGVTLVKVYEAGKAVLEETSFDDLRKILYKED